MTPSATVDARVENISISTTLRCRSVSLNAEATVDQSKTAASALA